LSRPSPLVIACLALGSLILGAEVCAIYRSRQHVPAAAVAEPADEPASAAPPPAVENVVNPPPPPAPAPSAPPVAIAPPPTADSPPPEAAAAATGKRPSFVAPDIETVIRAADEQAFQKLDMPEATRAAIRRINEEHAQKLHALRAGEPGASSEQQLNGNTANITAFRQTRREALEEILGADTAIRFERTEHAATKRLHNQFRVQSLHGVPPGDTVPTPP
jgi:hypothetical protein